MATSLERITPERAWVAAAVAAVVALVGGSLAFPAQIYDRFVWQYFWGPVFADAHNARCAVREGGSIELLSTAAACGEAAARGAIVAEPGYTVVSEVGYAVTLVFMLAGVLFLLGRLDIGTSRDFFFALVPFVFFGGALRVVEDANDAVPAGVDPAVAYPWNALIISPIIYFTVFAITLVALLSAVALDRRGVTERFYAPLAAIGTLALVVTLAYLLALAFGTDYVYFWPQVALVVLVGATLVAGGVWLAVERYAPRINRGTGYIGLAVLWGHAVDGVANVVGLDWMVALTPSTANLVPKHPVNRALVNVGAGFPDPVVDLVGTAWPFLVVKIVAALAVVWIFDEEIFRENPRYAILLLVAILAVGLGPGTRDMLRATFGI